MRTLRSVGLLGAVATLALAGLLRAQTVDPFSLTTDDTTTTTDSTTILPGLITVASVEPDSTPVASPDTTVTRPGRSP